VQPKLILRPTFWSHFMAPSSRWLRISPVFQLLQQRRKLTREWQKSSCEGVEV